MSQLSSVSLLYKVEFWDPLKIPQKDKAIYFAHSIKRYILVDKRFINQCDRFNRRLSCN